MDLDAHLPTVTAAKKFVTAENGGGDLELIAAGASRRRCQQLNRLPPA